MQARIHAFITTAKNAFTDVKVVANFVLINVALLMYTNPVLAQMINVNLDEQRGPFGDIICVFVRWSLVLAIALAMLGLCGVAASFVWGAEFGEMMKKVINGVLVVVFLFAGLAMIAFIARRAGAGWAVACS